MSAGRGEFERLKKDSRKIKLREELQRLYHRIKKWGSISAATEKGGEQREAEGFIEMTFPRVRRVWYLQI